jgi:hypothetical protein
MDWLMTDPTVVAGVSALRAAVIALAAGVLAMLAWMIGMVVRLLWGLRPQLQAAITEWLTTKAFARWTKVAEGAAAEIADPGNPAVSVKAKAAELVRGLPDAAQVLGGDQAAAERAINRALSTIKVGVAEAPKQ